MGWARVCELVQAADKGLEVVRLLKFMEVSVRTAIIAATLFAAAFTAPANPLQAQALPSVDAWQIGPIIRSRNYSVGMPLYPVQNDRSWHFDFPYPSVDAGHVHYLTYNQGPLSGRRSIVLRYRIDAAAGVQFVSREHPQLPATLSIYFQRRGDNWSGMGRYEAFRWYSPNEMLVNITPGEHTLKIDLDDPRWISVWGHYAATNPAAFRQAIEDTERVGFVFGSKEGRGHGVYTTGPARFTVLSFQVF